MSHLHLTCAVRLACNYLYIMAEVSLKFLIALTIDVHSLVEGSSHM